MLTNFNKNDILLSDGRKADFSFKSKAQSRFRKTNRFSSINRNVPFLLGVVMPSGVYEHKLHSEETRRKMSLSKMGNKNAQGHKPWNKGKKGSPHSKETRLKLSQIHRGEKSYLWKGGITPILEAERHRIEFRLWREAVFLRDNWTCQKCKKKKSGCLQSHHIKSFRNYPELRFDVNNGKTLCEDCHRKTNNYAKKANKEEGGFYGQRCDL